MRKMIRLLTSVVIALTMVMGLMPLGHLTAYADGSTVINMGNSASPALTKGNDAWTADNNILKLGEGSYKLTSDITTTTVISVSGTVTLDLNGYGILTTGNNSVIAVESGANLTLEDSSFTKTNTVYIKDGYGVASETEGATASSVNGGYISGGNTDEGGGVYNEGTLNLLGGTVIGNKARLGGGVYNGGTCTMSGGTITENTSKYGGGVNNDGTFTISGGTISENVSIVWEDLGGNGGGVFNYGGTFVMNAGMISGNKSETQGGGVYNYKGTFILSDGAINGNYAGRNAGGIDVFEKDTFYVSGTPVVKDNTKGDNKVASNVFLERRDDEVLITIVGELKDGASIGVTCYDVETETAGKGTFAVSGTLEQGNAKEYTISDDDIKKFSSDVSGLGIGLTDDKKEVYLKEVSYTVPVVNEQSVQVGADIMNGTATVSEITNEQIDQAAGTTKETTSNTLTIDLSNADQDVQAVTLTKSTVDTLAETVASTENNISTVTVTFSNASAEFDAGALDAISKGADGANVTIAVEEKETNELTETQQEKLTSVNVEKVISTSVTSKDAEINDFGNGSVKMSVADEIKDDRDKNYFHVYHLDQLGSLTRYVTEHTGLNALYRTNHFSEYVIVYDETDMNENIAPINNITIDKDSFEYDGEKHSVKVTSVTADAVDQKSVPAEAYEVSGFTATKAGTYLVRVKAKKDSGFRGSATAEYKITKGETGFKLTASKTTLSKKALAKKSQVVKLKVSDLTKGSSKPVFRIVGISENSKKVKLKGNKLLLRKGIKKTTIKIEAISKANKNRGKAVRTIVIRVK